ncbi:TonB-dependent receptor [Polaribacter litorisediminis]|uniref:TonB-dependent receptor n=1 Tax=Polaribacter litorisediminis TaxID=1908341 RepID=UPI001CC04DE1|nr:TonB-dependent receptor [Polaribacter litorisediminis]UAM97991.1 TonB-dependent receptor [Polaribacter litorisediminis]
MKKVFRLEGTTLLSINLKFKMRFSLFILILSLFQLQANNSFSQNKEISIEFKKVNLEQVLNKIESLTQFKFIYKDKEIDYTKEVSIVAKKEKLSSVLNRLFSNTNVIFEFVGEQIILKLKEDQKSDPIITPNNTNNIQDYTIKGVIKDTSGLTLPGASVLEKGTYNGTQSDFDGKFSLTVKDENATLIISYLGYKTKEILVDGQKNFVITLKTDTASLDEIVVVGYGKQRKADVVGAISSISSEKIKETQTANIGNNLTGRIPGLVINQRGGEPGVDNVGILIRGLSTLGNNYPLIVIDGIANRGSFERLNPDDIESISVLKDASAAIYGAQSANGVILVTTKRGKNGETVFSFDNTYSFSQPTRRPNYMNALQYYTWIDELNVRNGSPTEWQDIVRQYRDGTIDSNRWGDTDWWEEVIEKWTPQTQTSISARGGGEKVKFFLSAQMLDQKAIYKGNNYGYKQFNARSNIDAKLSDNLTISFDIAARIGQLNRPTTDPRAIIGSVIAQSPSDFPYFENGLLRSNGSGNPIPLTNGQSGYKDTFDRKFDSKFSFRWDLPFITKGLYLDGYAAIDYYNTFRKELFQPFDIFTFNEDTDEYTNLKLQNNPTSSLFQSYYEQLSITPHIKIGYDATFDKHKISSFIAYEQFERQGESFFGFRQGLVTSELPYFNFGSDVNQNLGGSGNQSARQNYFGRINYSYNDKYLVDFTLRYDGSENFATGKRFGLFPAVSLGWKISNESFFDSKLISNLKLRASWGVLGNDAVPNFQYFQTYGVNNNSYIFGDPTVRTIGLTPNRFPNPNITWETSQKTNIGIDFAMINGLLDVTVDAFYEYRSDILLARNASVPTYSGIVLPDENLGEVENSGIEFQVNHQGSIGNDFKYTLGSQFSYSRSKIIFIDEPTNIPEWQRRTGKPIDYLMVYEADGIFQNQEEIDNHPHWPNTQPGDVRYRDVSGDGVISQEDQVILENSPTPRMIYGINMGAEWKNISLNLLFQGQAQAKTIYRQWDVNQHAYFYNNRWTSEERTPNAIYPAAWGPGDTDFDEISTVWMKNNSFVRLKNVELAYRFDEKIVKKLGVSSLRFFVSAHNLFIIHDNVKFDDPESNVSDGRYYPQQRLLSTGINLKF